MKLVQKLLLLKIVFLLTFVSGCQDQEFEAELNPEPNPKPRLEFKVESVSESDGIKLMSQFSSISAKFSKDKKFEIIKVTNNLVEHATFIAAPLDGKNSRTNSSNNHVQEFYIFPEGNVDGYITVRNEFNPYGNVKMEITEPQFQHRIYNGDYNRFGSSNLALPSYVNYSWWSNYEDCLGHTHSPTDSNFFNIVTVATFDALTFGGYTLASLFLVCPGYATFT